MVVIAARAFVVSRDTLKLSRVSYKTFSAQKKQTQANLMTFKKWLLLCKLISKYHQQEQAGTW